MLSYFLLALASACIGCVYAGSFVLQQRSLLSGVSYKRPILLFLGRFTLFIAFCVTLLTYPIDHAWVGLVVFVTTYWATILFTKKGTKL